MRRHLASEYGFVMPEVRLTDDPMLPENRYAIMIHGIDAAGARVEPGRVLVLTRPETPLAVAGLDVSEPVFGAPARWIAPEAEDDAAALGLPVIAPAEVVATHLLETVKDSLGRLCTRAAVRRIIDALTQPSDASRGEATRRLIDEFVPDRVPVDALQAVMRGLLEERVPVRNLPLILEAAAAARAAGSDPTATLEHVRQRLAFILRDLYRDEDGRLAIVRLDDRWEAVFATGEEPPRRREGATATGGPGTSPAG
ncbi:MAG: FHIPEP family type III secretion protein, partial [Pseudomonadota bacterium]